MTDTNEQVTNVYDDVGIMEAGQTEEQPEVIEKPSTFEEANMLQNEYYEKFQACKKSIKRGAIIGAIVALAQALLSAGGSSFFGETFWMMLIIGFPAALLVVSGIAAVFYTAGFGLSSMVRFMIPLFTGIWEIFCVGRTVTIGVAFFLYFLLAFLWAIPLFIFIMLFPLEVLYYTIRYSIQKASIKKEYAQ